MKKIAIAALIILTSLSVFVLTARVVSSSAGENMPKEKDISKTPATTIIADFNRDSLINNLYGESGTWEKNPEDKAQWITASLDNVTRMGESGSSLRLEYNVNSSDAVNGFWTQLRDFDASAYDHFEFWVKGDEKKGFPATFKVEFKKFQKSIIDGADETITGSYIVKGVNVNWQKISIPLNVMNGITDWEGTREMVITLEKKRVDQPEGALYLDDFAFVRTGNPGPSINDVVEHKTKKTDKELASEEFAKFLIARIGGFPKEVFVKKSFPKDDKAFLKEIARDTWKYFDLVVDKQYGLPLDYIQFADGATVSKDTRIGDYTNVTDIGMYLMCVVSAYDFGFITKEEAVKRLNLTLSSIEKLEKFHNFPYNYYDITIFQRTSNFISYVDSGWLAAGMIVVKNAFPKELGGRCQKLIDSMDFGFFYDNISDQMYHGFYTNINYYSEYRYGALYTEPRAISYIAIGKKDVPKQHWFALDRTPPETWFWQTQTPKGRKEKTCLGCKFFGGYYTYEDLKFVPSWGGSMFEALMPTLIINEKSLAPKGLGLNDEMHAKIQAKYALEKLNYPAFGMSPCFIPEGGYSEYGVKLLGMKGYKDGVITPHATFLALEFTPKECVNNLRAILEKFNAYGEYGFYDAINAKTGKVATGYLCLDQAMSFIALNNYLNSGAIRKRFHADPIAKNAEELLKVENFFD